jgi:hypothetical protein
MRGWRGVVKRAPLGGADGKKGLFRCEERREDYTY